MYKVTSIFFLFFFSCILFAKSSPVSVPNYPIFIVEYSESDLLLGKHFNDLYYQLKKNRIKNYTLGQIDQLLPKSYAFPIYKDLFFKIKNLSKISDKNQNFHTVCKFDSPEKISSVNKKFYNLINLYCHNIFLKNLSRRKKITNFSNNDIEYFKKHLSEILIGKHFKTFTRIFKKFVAGTLAHKILSKELTSYYLQKDLSPPKVLLEYMDINNSLTTHIQSKGIIDPNAKRFFIDEFKKINRSYSKAVKDGDLDKAKKYINFSLSFYMENRKYISSTLAWKKFISAGSYFIHKNQKDLAYTLFKYSRKIASNEDENFDSIFKLVWGHLLTKDFKESMKVIEKERLIQKFDKLPSKLQYWVVVACEKNNEINLAKYLYKQLIDNSPLNFYSIMALNNIKKLQPNSKRKRTNDNIYKSTPFYNLPIKHFDVNFLSSLHRLQIWIDSGIEKFIPQEISSILSSNKKDVVTNQKISKELNQKEFKKQITLNLIHLLAFKGKHLQTFKLVYRSLNKNLFALTDKTIKFLFPFHYLSQIQKIEKDLDPIIILSLIRQESAFNPSARSIAGARGLMQIMPNTARMYKKKMKVSQLKNPEFNLKIGIKFLKSLLNRYDGNLIYALAAYNAGPTRLRKWTTNLFSSEDPLMIIESIPYKETRNYVKLIYRNIYFYQILTNNKIIITDPENVFQVSEFSKSN